jgi:hypothetical protein
MDNQKYIKREKSRAPLKTFTLNKQKGPTVYPNFSFDAVLQLIESDPLARGALNHFIDKCMEGDYAIIRRDDQTYDYVKELLLDENYNFRSGVLAKVFLSGKLFNNVFIEVVRGVDGRTKALNVLDSSIVNPITEPNGDPIKYVSNLPNPVTGEYAEWDKEDIVWLKIKDRTVGYAPVDMRALWENLNIKSYIRRYVCWLHKTGQYRLVYNFKTASTQDIQDFITYAKANSDDFDVPFIVKGEFDAKLLRDMRETQSIVEMLKYLDSQTLVLLRVPPIDAGIPDSSGRSNADAQSNTMETSILSFKKNVEDFINFNLFPKINMGTYLLRFSPISRVAEKSAFEVAQIMQSLGMDKEVIQEYLTDKGILFSKKQIFTEPKLDQVSAAFNQVKNPRDKDMYPSRLGKGAGEANKNQEDVTTREDQLHTQQ